MKVSLFLCGLCLVVTSYAKINFDLALMRGTTISFQTAVSLAVGQKPVKAFQDETTFIEAELLSENDDMSRVKLTVLTKNENGMFLVRGMPEVTANVAPGLCMSSIQCNSAQENFVLLVAMSKI